MKAADMIDRSWSAPLFVPFFNKVSSLFSMLYFAVLSNIIDRTRMKLHQGCTCSYFFWAA